jgi:glycosyltransferase involved in cell wall biosynthesis
VVVDNSDVPDQDWSVARNNPRVVYEKIEGKQTIGWLRNKCIELALKHEFEYLVFWDDDDYYPPTRISSGIRALENKPEAEISASSGMFMLLTRENVMMKVGPFHDNHGTAATYTVRRRFIEKARFDPKNTKGEEAHFTNMWQVPIAQVPSEESIVVMGHAKNTVDKSDVLKRPNTYRGTIVNSDNGRMYLRSHWPVRWDIFRATFSV